MGARFHPPPFLKSHFDNLQDDSYWSGTKYAPDPERVWRFTHDGWQHVYGEGNDFYAWAVRSGNVAAVVPLPAAGWLMFSALMLLGPAGWRRRLR